MTFGEALRIAREEKNWSREYLEKMIVKRCADGSKPITAETIKFIETGRVLAPRNGTKATLCKFFPNLSAIT